MSASRILTEAPLPPTLILLGKRDHLREYQLAFLSAARDKGQKFDLVEYEHGGHSFMTQSAFIEPSTKEVDEFLQKMDFLPAND